MTQDLWMAVAGGLTIGLAAVLLMALNGRIAGISGMFWGALSTPKANLWRWCFLAGLVLGGILAHRALSVPLPSPSTLSPPMAVAGGLLVGFGVKLGNGCTSGHGVCGIGLRSLRSLSATLMFMATGIGTVFVVRHLVGLPS